MDVNAVWMEIQSLLHAKKRYGKVSMQDRECILFIFTKLLAKQWLTKNEFLRSLEGTELF